MKPSSLASADKARCASHSLSSAERRRGPGRGGCFLVNGRAESPNCPGFDAAEPKRSKPPAKRTPPLPSPLLHKFVEERETESAHSFGGSRREPPFRESFSPFQRRAVARRPCSARRRTRHERFGTSRGPGSNARRHDTAVRNPTRCCW